MNLSAGRPLAARLLACAVLALGTSAQAGEVRIGTLADLPPPPHPPLMAAIAPPPATLVQTGQLLFIDPATGIASRNAPDPAALLAATANAPRAAIDMSVRTMPDGEVYIDTTGLQESMTAVLAADGTLHVDCGHPADHPSHFAPEPQP